MTASRTKFGPYTIVSPLGAGGMGEVYRAHDPRLGRDVAIKILAAHRASDPDALARMIRESRLVAALDHPGVVTIHDVGEEDGQFYLVTELVEGETLRDRLKRGPLPTPEALDYAMTIASALAAAHVRGVVHRDLKPENVMISAGGRVKVLDFGIAKFVAPAEAATAAPQPTLTEAGTAVGTPPYMAPEQLDGRTIDHRVDQFAFGVMVYELLAGRRPFNGATAPELSAAILRDEPAHLTSIRRDVPAPLARIVVRCLAKSPDDRYASTTDLAHAMSDVRTDWSVLTPPAAIVDGRPARGFRWLGPAVVIAAIAAAIAVGWRREAAVPVPATSSALATRAVAVLPFTMIGGDERYLADGITEAVTRELGHVEGARVIASSSAFAYRDRTDDFAQIARELGVDVMVRGSVQRAGGDRLRINAALLSARDNTTLWSNNYDRSSSDILAVQDDIAWQVAAKLAATFGAAAPPRPLDAPRTSPDAYDAFLRGQDHMRRGSAGLAGAIASFERAVALDGNFGLARAKLASAYTQQFFYNATDPALEQKAFLEIQKSLAINPDQAEAYLARAQLIWNLRNGFPHERAIADVRRAIANNPNLAEAHVELGKFYYHIGLIDKAISANEEALKLDPRSTAASMRIIGAKIDGGMAAQLADELARNPQWSLRSRSGALSFLGKTEEAIEAISPRVLTTAELKKLDMSDSALLAQLLARAGRRAEAERTLTVAIPLAANPTGLSDTHHAQFAIGCAYALLGKHAAALEWITKAANEGYPSYPRFSTERDLAPLRGHPAFEALLTRLRKDHERWLATL